MVTVNTIVSQAQNAIFDIERSRVQEGEWVDMVKSALLEIGKKTHGYIQRAVVVPVPDINSPVTNVVELDPATSPYILTRVVKLFGDGKAVDCEELSSQAVLNTQQIFNTFELNRTFYKDGAFSTKLQSSTEDYDNTISLIFNKDFELGEQVIVDYVGLTPFSWDIWNFRINPPVAVPDWFEAAFKYKLFYLVFELLFNRGDQFYYSRMQNAEYQYQKHILELASYSRIIRNKGDVMRVRPINWLEE